MDVKEALELFTETKDYWSNIYEQLKEDVRFSIGLDHWSKKERDLRGEDNCLVVPVLPQFIHQVMNDMRMNTPSINVLPGEGGNADVETAKIFKGLIRNIEYRSKADEVYDTGGEYAVRGGLGFARVLHDYISDDSFLQELKLGRVHNPTSVYLDPSYTECDGSDAEFGFVLEPIKKKQFEKKYPGKKFTSFGDAESRDPKSEEIVIAEVFVKKYTEIKKQMAEDGSMIDAEEDTDRPTRKLRKVTIERYKFSGEEELEKTTFPGIYIPIVPFHGEEVWDDGKRNLLSLIHLAKDAQRRVNKWASKESELLDMAPIAPVMAPFGALEDFKDEWDNQQRALVLRYKSTDAAGNPLDKPERLMAPQIPAGFVNAMQGANEQVKQAMGMYNASIGQRSNETSGVAIDARKVEGEVATFHFGDNRNRSIQHIGRILVCAIPEIYDTDRIIQIIGEEEEPKLVGINGAPPQEGQEQHYDLRKGKYDVRVVTGASYTTKRQEAAQLYGDLLTKNPQMMGVFGDLWAKNLDVAGAEALSARIRKTIPKELLGDEDGEQPIDPEKEQMAQIIQQLQAELQGTMQALEDKNADREFKRAELGLKQEELGIKMRETEIKAAEARAKITEAQKEMPIVDDTAENHFKEREMQLKEAEFVLKTQQALLDVIREANQPQQIPQENNTEETQQFEEVQAVQMEQHNAQLAVIQQTLEGLINAIQQPIQIIRDENGAIVGAE